MSAGPRIHLHKAGSYSGRRGVKPAVLPSCVRVLAMLDPGYDTQHRYVLFMLSEKAQRQIVREMLTTWIFQRAARKPEARRAAHLASIELAMVEALPIVRRYK